MINLSSSPPLAEWPASESLSRLTLDIVAAPTLSRLQDVALRGALVLGGAREGVLTLRGDSFEAPGAATSRESQTLYVDENGGARVGNEKALPAKGEGWKKWPLALGRQRPGPALFAL